MMKLTSEQGTAMMEHVMSSHEISTILGKKHKHVLRDIGNLIEEKAIDEEGFDLDEWVTRKGKSKVRYYLNWVAMMVLVTGYTVEDSHRFLDHLESQFKDGALPPLLHPKMKSLQNRTRYIQALRSECRRIQSECDNYKLAVEACSTVLVMRKEEAQQFQEEIKELKAKCNSYELMAEAHWEVLGEERAVIKKLKARLKAVKRTEDR